MEKNGLNNDTRGWILCIVSGAACVAGSAIICVDLIIRYLPGKRNFRIQESNVFLACSLSLSFGVMLFSALFSMLPSSKHYLLESGYSDQRTGLTLMGCFVLGFIGIQTISRFLHQFMPSQVVDCDHSHEDDGDEGESHSHSRRTSRESMRKHRFPRRRSSHASGNKPSPIFESPSNGHATESTPLIGSESERNGLPQQSTRNASSRSVGALPPSSQNPAVARARAETIERRPSMVQVQRRVLSFVKDTKNNCDEMGPCYGYSDPCGQACFKHLSNRSSYASRQGTALRTSAGSFFPNSGTPAPANARRYSYDEGDYSPKFRTSGAQSRDPATDTEADEGEEMESGSEDLEAQHHHHVPTNAFLSIGLQTSIAIALHKFPEGFITYATNHANPTLGFNIFMALFVHNITEGFAMALPLYMALGSRMRAMLWSSLLGGLSQPLGAGVAVLWFKLAKRTNMSPNAVVYACLFAVTAGIMVSVALQLFVESLSLNHNRNLCILFAFLGMVVLGLSSALVADH